VTSYVDAAAAIFKVMYQGQNERRQIECIYYTAAKFP